MLYEIIATSIGLGIGVITAFLTAHFEYRKDEKEKLQDRKGMWLNEHYQELSIEFKNLANFNTSIWNSKMLQTSTRDLRILETNLVIYRYFSIYIKVYLGLELDNVKKTYKNSNSHLEKGYPDVYEKMVELWQAEVKYKDSLSNTLNDILKKAQELMESNFPALSPSLKFVKKGENSYNIVAMIQSLLKDLVNNIEDLKFDQTLGTVEIDSINSHTIVFFSPSDYDNYHKFENNVWKPLNNEFKEKINKLNENNNNLSKLESKFQDSIRNIIDDYDSGHSIEGHCDVCDKIYYEKDITKLRPKV